MKSRENYSRGCASPGETRFPRQSNRRSNSLDLNSPKTPTQKERGLDNIERVKGREIKGSAHARPVSLPIPLEGVPRKWMSSPDTQGTGCKARRFLLFKEIKRRHGLAWRNVLRRPALARKP